MPSFFAGKVTKTTYQSCSQFLKSLWTSDMRSGKAGLHYIFPFLTSSVPWWLAMNIEPTYITLYTVEKINFNQAFLPGKRADIFYAAGWFVVLRRHIISP